MLNCIACSVYLSMYCNGSYCIVCGRFGLFTSSVPIYFCHRISCFNFPSCHVTSPSYHPVRPSEKFAATSTRRGPILAKFCSIEFEFEFHNFKIRGRNVFHTCFWFRPDGSFLMNRSRCRCLGHIRTIDKAHSSCFSDLGIFSVVANNDLLIIAITNYFID